MVSLAETIMNAIFTLLSASFYHIICPKWFRDYTALETAQRQRSRNESLENFHKDCTIRKVDTNYMLELPIDFCTTYWINWTKTENKAKLYMRLTENRLIVPGKEKKEIW